jgi:integrase
MFPHATKRWAKKVRGQLHYFGPWNDPEAALAKWLDVKDDLLAGRKPRVSGAGVTIRDLCNHFLTSKEQKINEGALTRRSWQDYRDTCERVISVFGKSRRVDDLTPIDFQQLRGQLAKGRGPETLSNDIQRARSLFKYGYDMRLIDRPADFGPDFKRPSKHVRRKARLAKPRKMFSAAEVRKLLGVASVQMKAMILLGINAGLGNSDCSALPRTALDLPKGIIEFPRPKTSIERRATLWPETVKALKAAISERPEPKNPADAGLIFITKYGHPWVQYRTTEDGNGSNSNSVTREFEKLVKDLNINREGVNFYSLRHTLETIGSEAGDQGALDRIMGHENSSMATHYREWLKDEREDTRLRRITNHVRHWLFGK